MVDIDFLKKVDVFKCLDEEHLRAVQACCDLLDYTSSQRLFVEGDYAVYFWIVKEGQIDLRFDLPDQPTSEQNNISSIFETMVFGWSSLVPPNKYTLSAYCASNTCKVVRMQRNCLNRLFEKDPKIGYRVMSNLTTIIANRFDRLRRSALDIPTAGVEITVHMGTCGIAAGSREVMRALTEEITKTNRKDIKVKTSGCLGKCTTEPNVTVKIGWENPVVYQYMNADKMRQVFHNHVIKGTVQTDCLLTA